MTKKDVLYTETHEWLYVEGNQGTIGISSYAAMHLGDIVFFDLPKVGTTLKKGDSFAAVESVKSASDIYMPVTGKIIEVNEALIDHPELVNDDPFSNWLIKIELTNPSESSDLMDVTAYEAQLV